MYTTPERQAARQMAQCAALTLTDAEINRLARDISEVRDECLADHDDEFGVAAAARELQRRIGGPQNLRSYLDCLMAQQEEEPPEPDIDDRPACLQCGRLMSDREFAEQRLCNDCVKE